MPPPVTLLIPNYNGARFLRETVTALLRQTYRDFQLVVVDNVSTDDSAAIVRSIADPRLRLVEAAPHVPIGASFKRAWRMVESPFFAVCASDEVYEPDWLETMVGLLDARPDAFYAICRADSADGDGRVYLSKAERYKDTLWPAEEPSVFECRKHLRNFMRGNPFLITLGLFRTSATQAIGELDDTRPFVGDWEYFVRGLLAGFTIVGTRRRVGHYRRHDQMTTHTLKADLTTFHAELGLIEWIAAAGYERGVFPTAKPDYSLVRNTVLNEYAVQLAAGRIESAARLLAFAQEKIPGFRRSTFDLLARSSGAFGRAGGLSLRAAEWSYLRLLTMLRHE